MIQKKIRLNSSTSVNSVNSNSYLDVPVEQYTKNLPMLQTTGVLNLYEQFLREREECEKYRLIVTVNPVCSNVLFNVLTEITKYEGHGDRDDDIILMEDDVPCPETVTEALGEQTPDRKQMIRNTEYSNDACGFTYHPGFDIFNNHILRNLTFKQVNRMEDDNGTDDYQEGTPSYREIFNTIRDLMRYSDGTVVSFKKRVNINSQMQDMQGKHLYDYSDIMDISTSVNTKLSEENGWFGFNNTTTIGAREMNDRIDHNYSIWGLPLNINRVINSSKSCEFIDMYPDRSLFFFHPKVNSKLRRLEYNWKFCITYPYSKTYDHILVNGDGVNGLDIYSVVRTVGPSAEDILLFRCTCKHGLAEGDTINLYYYYTGSDTEIVKNNLVPIQVKVKELGDLNRDYQEYYFSVACYDILYYFYSDANWYKDSTLNDTDKNNADFQNTNFRFRKVSGGLECEYYIRLFKKLPNTKFKKKNITEEIGKDNEKLKEYVRENASFCLDGQDVEDCDAENLRMLDFSYDLYRLGFSNSIYNDAIAQATFLDSVDVSEIYDNNGMPVTELFLTIIKNNAGHEKWYTDDRNDEDVEYSHCFGKLTSGFELLLLRTDRSSSVRNQDEIQFSDVHKLHNLTTWPVMSSVPLEDDITITGSSSWYSGEAEPDVFWGDLVEFDPSQVRETTLETVHHRFNTLQRELEGNDKWSTFTYDEIAADDFDRDVFNVSENTITEYNGIQVNLRPEGYYYKAHYPIMIKEKTEVQQASDLTLSRITVTTDTYSNNPNYCLITTAVRNKFTQGQQLAVRDNVTGEEVFGTVETVVNPVRFTFSYPKKYTFGELKSGLSNGSLSLIKLDTTKPDYAYALNDGSGRYLWRNVRRVGDVNNRELPEYPFTNGCFYIQKSIDFFLKRQDPFGYTGLYYNNFPNDVEGNQEEGQDTYSYVGEEGTAAC